MAEKVRDPPHPDWNGLRAVTPEHTSSLDSVATSVTWMEEQLEAELPQQAWKYASMRSSQ